MKSLKISPLFSVMTLLLALFIVVMVNLTIIISEDVDFLKRFLPLANLLLVVLGFFAVIAIKQIERNAQIAAESSLLKAHLSHVESLIQTLQTERHEHGRHIQTIQAMIYLDEYQDAKEYIEGIVESFWHASSLPYISSPTLAALIHSKSLACETLGVKFDVAIKCTLSVLPLKPWDLASVLGNLLDNAIEAAIEDPESKSVCLEIKDECDHCNIYVYNTGAPITNKKKIFEPGYTTKGSEARGYGLFLVEKIVSKYNGTISLYTRPRTVFIVSFPKKEDAYNASIVLKEMGGGSR
ncbi:MAG: GHKL domain-containing protein [Syntrophomonadaceae bacterium]